MRKLSKFLVVLFLMSPTLAPLATGGDTPRTAQPARQAPGATDDQVIGDFWKFFEQGKAEDAMLQFTASWPDRAQATDIAVRMADMSSRSGKYLSHAEITHRNFDGRVIFSDNIVFFEQGVVRFQLIFARPTDKWQGMNFQFSYDLVDQIAAAARK